MRCKQNVIPNYCRTMITVQMLAITRNEDTHLQENIVLMNGSLGELNMHGRSLRRKPQRDFIPRTLGKLYPVQSLQQSTLHKVHSILSYLGSI